MPLSVCHWFTDDTNIVFSSKGTENVENKMNIEMSKIHMWLCKFVPTNFQ